MNIDFKGYEENILTFACSGTVAAGDIVSFSSSNTVAKASADSDFIGVCVSSQGDYAAVQLNGYIELPKSGTITAGYNKLVAASSGVKAAETGIDRLVIYVDDTTVGFIL